MMYYLNQLPNFDIKDQLSNVHVPTLVIAGKNDHVIPASQSRIIAEKVPHCELVLLDGKSYVSDKRPLSIKVCSLPVTVR